LASPGSFVLPEARYADGGAAIIAAPPTRHAALIGTNDGAIVAYEAKSGAQK
jgi:hypothetical protein